MSNENQNGFMDVFFSKLKEQSFTILIMVGVIWYQGRMMEERVAYWQKLYEEKESYIVTTNKEEKTILLERINYLQNQRDKDIENIINKLKTK